MDTPQTGPATPPPLTDAAGTPGESRWAALAALLRDDVLAPRNRPSREIERAAAALQEYVRRSPARPA